VIALAVYGTLRRGERNAALLGPARSLGSGRIAGRLYVMPRTADRPYAYPALIVDEGAEEGEVVVELLDLVDPDLLTVIDRLEAFDPADPIGSEYVRHEVPIRNATVATPWVYVYNGPRAAMAELIVDGDWVRHSRSRD
jgi:gamma-glutamylcyclotransferase (GGCT)/AIG2-like uncharacterized protein YtfP